MHTSPQVGLITQGLDQVIGDVSNDGFFDRMIATPSRKLLIIGIRYEIASCPEFTRNRTTFIWTRS